MSTLSKAIGRRVATLNPEHPTTEHGERLIGPLLALLALVSLTPVGCRKAPEAADVTKGPTEVSVDSSSDVVLPETTGNERWVQPPGTAKITFFVDDRANRTFADGDMVWTGSFAWNEADNTIRFATSWGPNDGPYPLLYDDGPVSQGGHEMEGAVAFDGIFSTEVYFKAEEDTDFEYGVLNELGFWMWEGPNGRFTVKKGSTETVNAQGLVLAKFGDIDMKLTVDLSMLNPQFSYVDEWESVNVYVKGSMSMWAPVQILDAGPDGGKGDEVAGDRVFTYVQSLNLGKHTGLLYEGQHAQFTLMFSSGEETWETAVEYKLLTEGKQKGAKEGVKAFLDCSGNGQWVPAELTWETDSWGSTDNTMVIAKCDGTVKPECTPEGGECPKGETCIDGKCEPWCDMDEECEVGKKCIENKCVEWCDFDEECGEGFECVANKCKKKVAQSKPVIFSVTPDSGPTQGGTPVVIAGSDFQDGAKVTFGNSSASNVVVIDASTIQCVTPSMSAGKVDVTVTNPDGGTDTFVKGFEYIEEALAPEIKSIEPTQGPVTGGTQVNIYGANFLPGVTVFFGTAASDPLSFIDSTHLVATSPPGKLGKVDITVVNPDSQQAVLKEGFEYVPNLVDYAALLPPLSITSFTGSKTGMVYAEVWEPNVTPGQGPGPGLKAELGFGAEETDPANWSWSPATYDSESGNNDVWKGAFQSPAQPGVFRYTFRFSLDGENWVYADSDFGTPGFQVDKAGTWEVLEPGQGPVIVDIIPPFGTVLGGTTVTLSGFGFDQQLSVSVGGTAVVPISVSEKSVVISTPKHAAGPVDVEVKNPDGKTAIKKNGFDYVLKFTPSTDGDLGEWDPLFLVATNSIESNWDPKKNALSALYIAYDDNNLYVGVDGFVEALPDGAGNYILGYIDVDFPMASGPADFKVLFDNDGNGDLDDALSNVLGVTVPGFGVEYGFGTRGMESYLEGGELGDSKFAGWRFLFPTNDFAWVQGTVKCSPTAMEAQISLATLFNGAIPPQSTLALFVKITNGYGGYLGLSNQTLPGYFNPDAVEEIGSVVKLDFRQ